MLDTQHLADRFRRFRIARPERNVDADDVTQRDRSVSHACACSFACFGMSIRSFFHSTLAASSIHAS
jgi:hypothetical protein